ncbi:hypothetical protein Pla22_27820 [Rubripirellula amarantea]|uniref:Uncharacterized protein n=2 Tax=Rubripirellula amarantea TaxID=2527999 RepID=A0A5C5WX00_9BACT|nr:hypothetical protein Pla22_27820 [Rubripirellula amarantea]
MMRLTLATMMAVYMTVSLLQPSALGQAPGQRSASQAQAAPQAPFGPLAPEAQAQLQKVLTAWQNQSQGTKTLELKFLRFHYDANMAPVVGNAPTAATKSEGEIKYAAPDRGLIRVDQIVFFNGMVNNQPAYKAFADRFGEHWVCNGKQLIEFDRNAKECKIEELPPEMQGKNIISSPLPFVFNLNANDLQQRYWVRQTDAGNPDVILLEVWPKRAEDRAQYKMVQVALDAKEFLPKVLVMYAPNFNAKTAPIWDHYEFTSVKRNGMGNGLADFFKNFIPEKPPADWKILRNQFQVPGAEIQQAAGPADGQKR